LTEAGNGLPIGWNIFIINNTEFTIITDSIRVIGFFGAIDFTKHINQ